MTAATLSFSPAARTRRRWFGSAPLWSIGMLIGVGALVLAPLASLLTIAAGGDVTLWTRLIADVLPAALADTVLLLGGVAVVTGAVGIGTAWLVTAHRFPGRDAFAWLLPLPLAVPTYITAYV